MTAVRKVGIAGAGTAGLATAILLAEAGVEVDVYEARPTLDALGSGITLQGNLLRALDRLGIWGEVQDRSFSFDLLGLRAPGPEAPVIATFPDSRTGGPDYPATAGMYRPDLARIMLSRAQQLGVRVHFSRTVTALEEGTDCVTVTLVDSPDSTATATHDVLVGADGVRSAVRGLIGIETAPEPVGMGIFRAFVKRPASVDHTELVFGGRCYIAGYCPTGPDTMYAYLVHDAADHFDATPAEAAALMAGLSQGYGGPWDDIRTQLGSGAVESVSYAWFTSHLVAGPWNRGRTVIIGDAAHSCPPTVAQGAAQAVEDALVLAEVLLAHDAVGDALWDAFHARRVPRATTVVEASTQICRWLMAGDRDADIPGTMRRVAALVVQEP
ncbi:FAD-dependent monooxygenase [Antribacter gilvus]|uniref:FAD-dependent monooxygenase n=1 Tax=Antribacter gilvus TaxID=2304675 RepID=UPI000F7840B5|nr:FAD-dependent monooxygenase [Antribacter gilvus]